MPDVVIEKKDETHLRIYTSDSIAREFNEYFSFEIPNAIHIARRKGINYDKWGGKKKLFHMNTRTLYVGLLHKLVALCKRRGYTYEIDFEITEEVDHDEVDMLIDNLELPDEPYYFQRDAVKFVLENKRSLILSPTSSGKSAIMYMISQLTHGRTLITVPTISLVNQLRDEFIFYGADPRSIQTINMHAPDKDIRAPIVISTWHSVYELPTEWFDHFNVLMGDEAHGYKSTSLVQMMEAAANVPYKIGLTGTTDDVQVNEMVLEGLFGRRFVTTTLRDMIDDGIASDIEIVCLVLDYPEEARKLAKKMKYEDEKRFVHNHEWRNHFIVNLSAASPRLNTLTLFQKIEEHGHKLLALAEPRTDKQVHYIHGKVDVEIRDAIKRILEADAGNSLYASYGTFSTGENVKNLHEIIFASPYKSKIKVLQSIGRGARKHASKTKIRVYDIVDDLSWNGKDNTLLEHFKSRVEIYNKEYLDYSIKTIKVRDVK